MSVVSLKIFLSKLKNTFVYRNLINNYIVIAIAIVLFFLVYHNLFFILALIIYLIYLYRKRKMLLVVSVSLMFIIWLKINIYNNTKDIAISNIIKVNDVIKYDDYQKIIYKKKYKKYIIYDFDNNHILPGDIIEVVLEKQNPLGERIEGGFNYQKYLKNNHIYGIYNLKDYKFVKKKDFNLNIIKYKLSEYINKNFSNESKKFLKALILGDKNDFDDTFLESLQGNGIIHLFAISGLHVGIIILILKKILKIFNFRRSDSIISLFLLIYLFITSFSPSIIRAVIMYYLSLVNKNMKLMLTSSDIISITFLLLVLINPFYIYNQGFVLSFAVSCFIILYVEVIKDKSSTLQGFLISLFSNFFVLPIIINMNNEINLLSPFVNVLFIFLMSSIILPLSFLVMIVSPLEEFYEFLINCFIKLSIYMNEKISIKIYFATLSKISVAIYYYLLLLILIFYIDNNKNIKKFLIFILSFFIGYLSFYSPTWKVNEVIFFDLDEGDSTLIINRNLECIALIDTGTGKRKEVTKFLKQKGIKKIDYLFLTHNHDDHNGEADNIIKEINVNKIVVSAYDNSDFSRLKNTTVVEKGDTVACGKMEFRILHPDMSYKDENDNSLVIYTKIGRNYFLFLGDSSSMVEEQLIRFNLKVDCIKIAHHGSSTSTSTKMIEAFKPKYAVIMTGRVKKFGFPNKKTINTLLKNKVIIYRTDLDYSIIYKFNKKEDYFVRTNKY